MRIIAGSLGGRQIKAPHGHRTHPMSEKMRGAIFNVLGDIQGLTVLDAFAGSGALAIEAISRGAKNVVAIDIDKNAHRMIAENIDELGVKKQVKAIKANVGGWDDNNPDKKFDLIFADPPHDDIHMMLLQKLVGHLKDKGIYVLSWPGHSDIPALEGLKVVEQKNYRDAQLIFYRK